MPPSPPFRPDTPPDLFIDAWNALQAEVELQLVTHAADATREREDGADEHPLALSAPPAVTGAGQHRRLWHVLRDHAEAERLRRVAPGVDVGVAVLAAMQRVEQARSGPHGGWLRPGVTGRSAAWDELCAAVQADTAALLWQRAHAEVARARQAGWPGPLQGGLEALRRALLGDAARAGTTLVRLAAADRSGEHGFHAPAPAPVAAALDWGIDVRVDATLDGAWMVQARRVAIAPAPAPADTVSLTLQVTGPPARVVVKLLAPDVDVLTWYETQPLGVSVTVWAESPGADGGARGHA
jgi:hypothetical protein